MTKADKEGQRKAPILRFKGFTDDWEQRKLGEIGKIRSCKRIYRNQTSSKGEIPFYKIGTFGKEADSFISRKLYEEYKERFSFPQVGDILISASGTLGRTVVYNGENAYFQDSNIVWIDNDNHLALNKYLEIYYQRIHWKASEGSTIKRLYNSDIEGTIISIPKRDEQAKLSKCLKLLNKVITLYEMKKQLLAQLKQGIVNFLITKNGQKPQLRFSGFNNDWESKSFEKLLNYEQPTKYIVKKADYISQGTPVLTANKSFILGYTNETNVYQNIPAIIFDDFTLESKYVDFPFMVKSSAIKILTSKNSNLFFIYQLLNNQKFVQEGHSRHYISVVQKKKVLVPSIQEQNKIGNLIKQLENNIEQNSDTIALLKSLKEFLLQNMFL